MAERRSQKDASTGEAKTYGELFGDADAEAVGDAAVGELASPGFTLKSSTSKMRVEFGPMSCPAPPAP
jgi:hypothetical protein